MLIASPVIFFRIKDSTDVAQDLKFSDETAAEVLGDKPQDSYEMEKPQSPQHEDTKVASS
jgi:hypothetical protein